MARKQYPIGIQTFDEIIKNDYLYIDKTEYIYRMTHTNGKHYFLSRPRRFGKSLLVSTMLNYFEGKKELFKGLAMEKLEQEWTEYPVLHFDMSGGKHMEREQLERYLADIISSQEKKFGYVSEKIDPNLRLIDLINVANEKTGKQVVVLIDEYDAPLLDVAHEGEQLKMLRDVMRNFYSPLKMCEGKLRFVFLTGITKFSQLSIFSELNNITNISMNDKYAGICGITAEELINNMSEDIEALAEKNKLTKDAAIARLKEYYDGYHFSQCSPDIFNPFSLLNCFAEKKFNLYWFSSGTPTYLINMMKKYDTLPSEISHIEANESEFDAPTENMKTIIPLLYQSGYITIKDYNDDYEYYTLGVPNKEVKVGLTRALIPSYVTDNTLSTTNTARRMAQALDKDDMNGAMLQLQTFLSTVPYCNNTNYEGHYQQMLYVIFTLLTSYFVDVEVHTPHGRVDVVMLSRDTLYVMELKLNQDAATAMRQINLKEYDKKFSLCGKPVVKVGINFDSTKGNITDWKIE